MKKLQTTTPLLLPLLCLGLQVRAYRGDLPDAVRQIVEDAAARDDDGDAGITALYEVYEELRERPLNLNCATAGDLAALQLLTGFQIQSLLEYRENYGPLYSIHELPLIPGFNAQIAAQLTPFVAAGTADKEAPERFPDYFTKGEHQALLRTTKSAGRAPGTYLHYRYKYRNNLQWGASCHDAGVYSAHVLLRNTGALKQLAVGDYQAQFGQGLVAWGGFAAWKSADALSIEKHEQGFTAHSGSGESSLLRGVAATIAHEQWNYSAFVSRTSGLVAGGNISRKWGRLKTGCTGLWRRPALPEEQQANIGADFHISLEKATAFGEIALGSNGSAAGLLGMLFELSEGFRVATLYRNYGKDYGAAYAKGFGENSKTANEQGWYVCLQWTPHRRVTLAAFADIYAFPWMKYRVDAPSSGWEYTLRAAFRAAPATLFSAQVRRRSKEANLSGGGSATAQIVRTATTTLRGSVHYEPLPGVCMEDRLALALVDGAGSESGVLLFHDVNYRHPTWPLTLSARIAVFDSDSWASRLYAYESDVPYAFSVPAYYAKGVRWFLNIEIPVWERVALWCRIAQTRYFDRADDGSGADLKLQLQVQL